MVTEKNTYVHHQKLIVVNWVIFFLKSFLAMISKDFSEFSKAKHELAFIIRKMVILSKPLFLSIEHFLKRQQVHPVTLKCGEGQTGGLLKGWKEGATTKGLNYEDLTLKRIRELIWHLRPKNFLILFSLDPLN